MYSQYPGPQPYQMHSGHPFNSNNNINNINCGQPDGNPQLDGWQFPRSSSNQQAISRLGWNHHSQQFQTYTPVPSYHGNESRGTSPAYQNPVCPPSLSVLAPNGSSNSSSGYRIPLDSSQNFQVVPTQVPLERTTQMPSLARDWHSQNYLQTNKNGMVMPIRTLQMLSGQLQTTDNDPDVNRSSFSEQTSAQQHLICENYLNYILNFPVAYKCCLTHLLQAMGEKVILPSDSTNRFSHPTELLQSQQSCSQGQCKIIALNASCPCPSNQLLQHMLFRMKSMNLTCHRQQQQQIQGNCELSTKGHALQPNENVWMPRQTNGQNVIQAASISSSRAWSNGHHVSSANHTQISKANATVASCISSHTVNSAQTCSVQQQLEADLVKRQMSGFSTQMEQTLVAVGTSLGKHIQPLSSDMMKSLSIEKLSEQVSCPSEDITAGQGVDPTTSNSEPVVCLNLDSLNKLSHENPTESDTDLHFTITFDTMKMEDLNMPQDKDNVLTSLCDCDIPMEVYKSWINLGDESLDIDKELADAFFKREVCGSLMKETTVNISQHVDRLTTNSSNELKTSPKQLHVCEDSVSAMPSTCCNESDSKVELVGEKTVKSQHNVHQDIVRSSQKGSFKDFVGSMNSVAACSPICLSSDDDDSEWVHTCQTNGDMPNQEAIIISDTEEIPSSPSIQDPYSQIQTYMVEKKDDVHIIKTTRIEATNPLTDSRTEEDTQELQQYQQNEQGHLKLSQWSPIDQVQKASWKDSPGSPSAIIMNNNSDVVKEAKSLDRGWKASATHGHKSSNHSSIIQSLPFKKRKIQPLCDVEDAAQLTDALVPSSQSPLKVAKKRKNSQDNKADIELTGSKRHRDTTVDQRDSDLKGTGTSEGLDIQKSSDMCTKRKYATLQLYGVLKANPKDSCVTVHDGTECGRNVPSQIFIPITLDKNNERDKTMENCRETSVPSPDKFSRLSPLDGEDRGMNATRKGKEEQQEPFGKDHQSEQKMSEKDMKGQEQSSQKNHQLKPKDKTVPKRPEHCRPSKKDEVGQQRSSSEEHQSERKSYGRNKDEQRQQSSDKKHWSKPKKRKFSLNGLICESKMVGSSKKKKKLHKKRWTWD